MKIMHRLDASYPDCSARTVRTVVNARLTFWFCALLFTPQAFCADISGIWKHAKEPGWIEIRLEEGTGTVVRNDRFPERVGRKILKDLETDKSEQGLWRGLIYVEKLAQYRDVEVSLPEPDRMLVTGKVGFMSRTVEWVRVDKLP